MINTNKLLILNIIERPCMHLVCREMPSGKVIYVNKILRRAYPNIKKSSGHATLEDFGFTYDVFEQKYKLTKQSRVKYSDGKPRKWQGKTEFTYEEIVNSTLKDD